MKTEFHLVVAYSKNRAIGRENKLLWHLADDMAFFKKLTTGKTVLMGRKTYESLPAKFRPLPNRINLVMSSQKPIEQKENLFWLQNESELNTYCSSNEVEDIYVIGGGEIYKIFLPYAKTIFATEVYETLEGDTFFPLLNSSEWEVENIESHAQNDKNELDFIIRKYTRKG